MDCVSGGSKNNEKNMPKETPSPSPVPLWDDPPDAPQVTYNWVDVTDDFKTACEGLELGELVHEPNFGLFEAMSAIEMMDPKMDVGMVGKQTKRLVLSFQDRIEQGSIKLNDLEPSQLIIIMDTCQACLVSWLDGQSLAHTVFTCLYLHDTDAIEDRYLKAYCLGILKLCDVIKEKIYKANVFEEEDFQTLTYGFKFASNLTDLRVIGMLKEVEDDISRAMRTYKSQVQTQNNDTPVNGPSSTRVTEYKAILARLKFLRFFLQGLIPFGKETDLIQGSKKHLLQAQVLLKDIDGTLSLGLPPTMSEDGHEIAYGFEPLVNQRLLPPTFPRYSKLRQRNELASYYGGIIKRLLSVIEMTTFQSFYSILEFVVNFAHASPCVLARSILQITFLPENRRVFGQHFLNDIIKESLRSFSCPPALSPRHPSLQNNALAKECIDTFLTRASGVIVKIVQVYGHNYARQREKLAGLLEELCVLQDEADCCDNEINSIMQSQDIGVIKSHLTTVGSWALHHSLRVMSQYLTSGFQLQLYSEHEFHYIYWYLAEVLLSWRITTIKRAESHLQRDELLAEQQQSSKSRSNKKSKKNRKKIRLHSHELASCQGAQMMAAGVFKAMLGFFMDGKMKGPTFMFDNEAIRYEHRFQPFLCISTPPFAPYKQFQEMTDISQYYPPPTAQDLYTSSSKHFGQAKLLYESMSSTSEVQQLLKVSKTNLVVTKLLAGGHKKESTSKPDFDFSANDIFPIIRIS